MELTLLNRELDRTKSATFLSKSPALLGSVMCSLEFVWDESISTAVTDGLKIWWNPDWFLFLPVETRKTVLLHELWHVAKLHNLRRGTRNHKIWVYACDLHINNLLEDDGYSFDGTQPWKDQSYRGLAEEQIYDLLIKDHVEPPPDPWNPQASDGMGDLKEPDPNIKMQVLNNVTRAIHQAKSCNESSTQHNTIREFIDKFLKSRVPWETLLYKYFTDLGNVTYSWKKPNRRYTDIYLPSRVPDRNHLEHLAYYIDVSGSVTESELIRVNSEIFYIKETFNPKKLTLVQFDTAIRNEIEVSSAESFKGIEVVARGGTKLAPVREHILKINPTAVIIFSDLACKPMQDLGKNIPVIWIVLNNPNATTEFGKRIHLTE